VVEGELAAHHFLPESLERPEVRRLVELTDTEVDAECVRLYPGRRSGVVRLFLADGSRFERRVLIRKARATIR